MFSEMQSIGVGVQKTPKLSQKPDVKGSRPFAAGPGFMRLVHVCVILGLRFEGSRF